MFKKILILLPLFLIVSCVGARQIENLDKSDLELKKGAMDASLNVCWEIMVQKNKEPEYGLGNWNKYNEYKLKSDILWEDYSKKFLTSFWPNKTSRNVSYFLAPFTLGISLIPTSKIFLIYSDGSVKPESGGSTLYKPGDHPPYGDLIKYCDLNEKYYKKQEVLAKSRSKQKEASKKEKERRSAEIERQERLEEERRKKARQQEINHAKKLGYRNGSSVGIINSIDQVVSGRASLSSMQKFLITKTGNDNFRVSNIVGNYVIYNTFRNYNLIQIAVEKDLNESYIDKSILKGKYFAITGKQEFTKTLGGNTEILILKRIK